MTLEDQLQHYLIDLNQEVRALVEAEEGSLLEDKATEYLTGILELAGVTESPVPCYDLKRDKSQRVIHKINGYSISEDEETIDTYVTWYEESNTIRSFTKADVTQAANQTERFFKNALNRYYNELDEAAGIYQFAYTLGQSEVQKKIIRINIFILTNARYISTEALGSRKIGDITLHYHIWDLERFQSLYASGLNREPIRISFTDETGESLPCLAMPVENEDYQSYLAILSGNVLASVYERYGAALLERNVRSFLQFGGKVNKGIRDTIRNVPHRFLAYNNGIAATAEKVETRRTEQGLEIVSVTDLQIVNGGQTTASIYQTLRQDKADLSQVFVQMKLTVIRRPEEMEVMVPLISRFSNSQNAIREADLSANLPFNIELEKLSRALYTPVQPGSTLQTRWFFERARGQYKVALNRELTAKNKKVFEIKNPRKQLFTKETAAKAIHSWKERPYLVARGAQKNYALFVAELRKNELPDNVFFEDLVAMLILHQAAEHAYGSRGNAFGDIKFLTVPYVLSSLHYLTRGCLNLQVIWQKQAVSAAVSDALKSLVHFVEPHIQRMRGMRLVGEYAKKEECWNNLKHAFDGYMLHPDLLRELLPSPDAATRVKRTRQEMDEAQRAGQEDSLRSIGAQGWKLIEAWGRQSDKLSLIKCSWCYGIQKAVASGKKIADIELKNGIEIMAFVAEENPELLIDLLPEEATPKDLPGLRDPDIDLTLVEAIMNWDRKAKKLYPNEFEYLKKTSKQSRPFTMSEISSLQKIARRARFYGFNPEHSGIPH